MLFENAEPQYYIVKILVPPKYSSYIQFLGVFWVISADWMITPVHKVHLCQSHH